MGRIKNSSPSLKRFETGTGRALTLLPFAKTKSFCVIINWHLSLLFFVGYFTLIAIKCDNCQANTNKERDEYEQVS